MLQDDRSVLKFVGWILATAFLLVLLATSFTTIPVGERGVVLQFGKFSRVLEPGLHVKAPLGFEEVTKMETRVQKIETQADAATRDLQDVSTTIAVQFQLDPLEIENIYDRFKNDYRVKLIDPAIQEAVKQATAKYNSEELITKRPEVKEAIKNYLSTRLASANILLDNVDIVNFSFSAEFNNAIERKVKAEQQALEQEQITKQEEEKKKQAILRAEAEAEKTSLEAQALLQNAELIEKIKAEASLEFAKKWNGQLPATMIIGGDGEVPFLPYMNISK